MSKGKWVSVKGATGIKKNTSDGRYQIRTAVRVGDKQHPQMIVLEPGYSLDEAEAIREMMKDALRKGEKLDKETLEPPGFQKVIRLQHGSSDDDFEELYAELAAAEARIEELEEQVAAALSGESEAVSAADWMRRAKDAEERLEEASNFEKQALEHKARADVAEKKLAGFQAEMDGIRQHCSEMEGVIERFVEEEEATNGLCLASKRRLLKACEEWGIEDLEDLEDLADLTDKVCAEYTNLYAEQTVTLRACEEALREQKVLPESLALELTNACERWGFEEPGEDVSLETVERVLGDYDTLCKRLDQVKPSTLDVVRGLEAECIVLRDWQTEACRIFAGSLQGIGYVLPECFHAYLAELCAYLVTLDEPIHLTGELRTATLDEQASTAELREWQAEACRLLTGKMHDQPIQPENFHANLAELCLYTDALDAGEKKHNKKVAMLAEDRDRRREEAKEALEAKARLEAELSEARAAIERLGDIKDLLLSACAQVLGPDRLGGMLTLTPEQLARKMEAAVLEDREIDVLVVEGEEDRERLVREHAIMFEALEQVMMCEPLDVLDFTGTEKQRANELAYQIRSEVLLQNTSDEHPNMDGPLLYGFQSARELPRELSRRIEQLEAELQEVLGEKDAVARDLGNETIRFELLLGKYRELASKVFEILPGEAPAPEEPVPMGKEALARLERLSKRERYVRMLLRDGWRTLSMLEERDPENFALVASAEAHRFLRLGAREMSQSKGMEAEAR